MGAGTHDEPAIEVTGLRKRYGDHEAVRGIDLRVERGEVFALLGPNGAGKTSTVEILEGLRERDAGHVRVLGTDPATGDRALKARVGVVLQETGAQPFLTVAEVIDLHRGWYPRSRPLDEILELVGLTDVRRQRATSLSGGQRRRLDVAVSLAGDPDLLFLDEPTTGFDPSARRSAWALVQQLRATGKTILLTTHYMDEAQHLADRVAVLVAGEIVAEGSPATLAQRGGTRALVSCRIEGGALDQLPPEVARTATLTPSGLLTIHADRPTEVLHLLTGWALASGTELLGLSVARPSLEDVYLELVGGAA